ncbi:hypothetical protein [Falsiroseomonas sp.]|jgi:hypothetical protein|uniref:hypothetical protein n=1 Tax=Falsiroseomonas sp. TaxID=2870721 RepID=UPI0034A1F542
MILSIAAGLATATGAMPGEVGNWPGLATPRSERKCNVCNQLRVVLGGLASWNPEEKSWR